MNEINLTPMVDILSAQLGEQVVMSGDSYVLLRDKSVVSSTDVDIATEEQNRLYLLAIEHAKPTRNHTTTSKTSSVAVGR